MTEVDFLLIHPWIYDFSAHDFWLKPYGLLKLAGLLRKEGYTIFFLDLTDPFYPNLPKAPKRKNYGTGHFYKEAIPKPLFFRDVPRRYFRYGLPFPLFLKEISRIRFKAVMLSISMTYWYPGLFVLIDFITKNYPEVPIFIGGIYAKLSKEHLLNFVKTYPSSWIEVIEEPLEEFVLRLKRKFEPSGRPHPHAYPAFDLYQELPYVILMTSEGCPFSCPYCASKRLYPKFIQKDSKDVIEEILFWHHFYGVEDFAFYDDALLINFDRHLGVILEELLKRNIKVRFHTPNALHARLITKEVAKLLKKGGFVTIRLGLERVEDPLDNKITLEEFEEAIKNLKEVGFSSQEIGAYLLYGLPDEDFTKIERALKYLYKLEVSPYLAEFSPIPGTPLFEEAKKTSRYPLSEDPLFTNKSVFPALKNPNWEEIQRIKNLARSIRKTLTF
ncbi:MAG: B12-binding domain-containing radical SAM protein [Caldimicrobium sp.]